MFGILFCRKKFLKEIEKVIIDVEDELSKRRSGRAGDGTEDELTMFLDTLRQMKREVETRNLPSKSKRISGMDWFILDSWSFNNPLGRRIIRIEQIYRVL